MTIVPPGPYASHVRSFEQYLYEAVQAGTIDFRLRAAIASRGDVAFYIHPLGKAGETRDYHIVTPRTPTGEFDHPSRVFDATPPNREQIVDAIPSTSEAR